MALINVKVTKIVDEASGIRSFELSKTGFFKLPKYTAGAHIDVHCGEGIIRQYSLCGDSNDRQHFIIAVKKGEPSRGGSDLMHQVVKEDDHLEIGSPRNNFVLNENVSHTILVAGGIGITPIISMADRLHDLGKSFELHYFSRGSEYTAFENRLESGAYEKKVSFHQGLDVNETTEKLHDILNETKGNDQVYICGPELFMNTAEDIALKNRDTDSVILERFSANPALSNKPTHAFEVNLARAGITLKVAANESLLESFEKNDIDAAFSCEQGVCGTCVTEVLDGKVDHRDGFLSDKQKASNTRLCICVSRAENEKLVLDI